MTTPRPRRTIIAGARAQFAGIDADVVNVSANGALVRAPKQQAAGSQWPLVLDLDGTPLAITVRVVRCEPVAGPLTTSTGKFALALTFVNLSEETIARLDQVCRSGPPAGALDERRVRVSFARRCPKCQSRDVAKESKRNYSCCQCGRVFTGFRLGFLRFSR
jgi:hypothetical protein